MLTIFFLCGQASAESWEYVYRNPQDSTRNCYLICLPSTQGMKGLIIRDYSSLPDTSKQSPYKLRSLAVANNMAIVYIVTSTFFPELYFDDSGPSLLDDIVHEIITRYRIPSRNIFIGGISASGTRALRYAQYCEEGKSKYGSTVKGVFIADSPLDIERFYYSAKRHCSAFKAGMLEEAKIVLRAFPNKLGGSPSEHPEAYRHASVYSFSDSAGGNVRFFKNLPILIFHEPDINWWIQERGASYYDMNSFDIAGFTAALQSLGSRSVELITTSGKGYDSHGNRNPHSWTIVDEQYLMDWILKKLQ